MKSRILTNILILVRGVARGGGGAEPPRNLADQLTLFEPEWADFAPHTTANPLGFKKLSTPLLVQQLQTHKQWTHDDKFVPESPSVSFSLQFPNQISFKI
jgi:hypothetical protein